MSNLAHFQQFGTQRFYRNAAYENLFLFTSHTADKLNLRTFEPECFSQKFDNRVISAALIRRRGDGDLERARLFADKSIAPRAGLGTHAQNASVLVIGDLDWHEFNTVHPDLQPLKQSAAKANVGRPFLDRDFEIVAHAHGKMVNR